LLQIKKYLLLTVLLKWQSMIIKGTQTERAGFESRVLRIYEWRIDDWGKTAGCEDS
jgi:hypothetical protein